MQINIPINLDVKGRAGSAYSTDHVAARLAVLTARPDQSDPEVIREREYLRLLQKGADDSIDNSSLHRT